MIDLNTKMALEHKSQTVFVVDDHPDVLSATERILRRGGYSVIAASNPQEALEKSRAFQGEIHLLLADVTMPAMDGIVLAQQILAEREHTRVLLMSGNAKVESRLPLPLQPRRGRRELFQRRTAVSA